MQRIFFLGLWALLTTPLLWSQPSSPAPNLSFQNGRWLRIEADTLYFEAGDRYSVGGFFQAERPSQIDSVIDLKGRYLVPPFGNAHTHSLSDSYSGRVTAARYLKQGVFYAMNLTGPYSSAAQLLDQFESPLTVDVAYSHGGITAYRAEGYQHPATVMERSYSYLVQDEDSAQQWPLEGNAYWFMETQEKIEEKWPRFMAQQPDIVKIYLMRSGEEQGMGNQCGYGLCPAAAREIVRRAHAEGLRVAAHVNTAADVRVAIEAGVDLLAHLPLGNDGISRDEAQPYLLSPGTIQAIAEAGMAVNPTANLLAKGWRQLRRDTLQAEVSLQRQQIRALYEAGVPILMGTDGWNEDPSREARYFAYYEILPNAALLRLWSHLTPKTIFPERRLGRLQPGYEASFLTLEANPLEDFSATQQIALRVKQGYLLPQSE